MRPGAGHSGQPHSRRASSCPSRVAGGGHCAPPSCGGRWRESAPGVGGREAAPMPLRPLRAARDRGGRVSLRWGCRRCVRTAR
jgi:hypothetical protein